MNNLASEEIKSTEINSRMAANATDAGNASAQMKATTNPRQEGGPAI
jgi:hypothetical protein